MSGVSHNRKKNQNLFIHTLTIYKIVVLYSCKLITSLSSPKFQILVERSFGAMLTAVSALLGIAGAYRLVCKGYEDYWQGQHLKEKALKKRAKRLNKAKNK